MAALPGASLANGAYRATVDARDATNTYWVIVDNYGRHPAHMLESWVWPLVATGAASAGTAHTHGPGHIVAKGDRVLVLAVAGSIDDLIILGRLV